MILAFTMTVARVSRSSSGVPIYRDLHGRERHPKVQPIVAATGATLRLCAARS